MATEMELEEIDPMTREQLIDEIQSLVNKFLADHDCGRVDTAYVGPHDDINGESGIVITFGTHL